MRAAFFDFTINFGGAPQGTISLGKRLLEHCDVFFIDVYGCCTEYRQKVLGSGLPLKILYPEARQFFIGHQGNYIRRFIAIIKQIPDFRRIRQRLKSTIDEIKPDVVWVNNAKSLVFLLGLRFHFSLPIIFYIRGWGTREQISPIFSFLLKKRVKYILAHAMASVNQLISYGISSEKIIYAPNAVELNVDPVEARLNPPDLPGIEKPLKILLPAARPVREKGHLTAVKALRRVIDYGYDAVVWFPGNTPTGVGHKFTKELAALIIQLKLENRVHFLGWHSDFQHIISNADVVILPSHTEGFPRVVIESMMLGTPVCATPVGGIPEAIFDGETGFIINIEDEIMLANKIIALANDTALRNMIVKNAIEFASKAFNLKAQTSIIKNVFVEAIKHA